MNVFENVFKERERVVCERENERERVCVLGRLKLIYYFVHHSKLDHFKGKEGMLRRAADFVLNTSTYLPTYLPIYLPI